MVKRARIRFIAVTMSILLCVFIVIAGGVYYFLRSVNERAIKHTLVDIELNFIRHGSDIVQNNGLVAIIFSANDGVPVYDYWFDQNAFTSDEATNLILVASQRASNFGSVDNVFYKISTNGNNYLLLVASDMTDVMAGYRSNIFSANLTLALIYLALFIIVIFLSYSVLKPVKDALYNQKCFISNASHELKTPLTIISANADVIKSTDNNQWVQSIKTQTERLNDLVGDMLTLAKLDEDKPMLAFVEFNLSEEIINSSLAFDALAFEKGQTITLDVDPDISYKGDIQSVKKIVNILLDNAVKHAVSRGEILVSLKKENGKIVFTVFNTGSNIPAQDSNRVFERFFRGDASRSRESGGSGLGLSIAKSIADVNKWKISAMSRYGESMTIKVIF